MKTALVEVIFILILGSEIQRNAATNHRCKNLLDFTRFKAPSNTGAIDCEKFIECKGGKEIHKSCPSGFGYNDNTKGCTWANEVCDGQDSLINDCTTDGEIFDNPAATECGSFNYCQLVPGSANPPQYRVESANCPTGEIFNPTVVSTYNGEGDKPCSTKDKYFCPTKDRMPDCHKIASGTYIPDPTNCYGYYYCSGGIRLKGKCNETSHHFDFNTKSCIKQSESSCKIRNTLPGICKGKTGYNVPDKDVCTAYYHCITDDLPQQIFCQDGYYFNNGYCDWNWNNQLATSKCSCEKVEEGQEINARHNDTSKYWECKYNGERRERTIKTCFLGTTFSATAESCVFDGGVFMFDDN